MSKPIAVLGRGTSLGRYAQFSHLFDKIYLTNPFIGEIEKLGEEHFKGKELVHVVSKGNDCRLKQDQYALFSKITVTANIITCVERPVALFDGTPTQSIAGIRYINFQVMPEPMRERGFPLIGWDDVALILRNMGDLTGVTHEAIVRYVEAGFSDVIAANNERSETTTRCWPTTGMFAVELALVMDSPEKIHLFGFDCFQKGTDSYFIGRQKSRQTKDALEVMTYYLRHLVKEFTATTFHSAAAQPDITEPNWKVMPHLE